MNLFNVTALKLEFDLKFCDPQRGFTPLRVAKFQVRFRIFGLFPTTYLKFCDPQWG